MAAISRQRSLLMNYRKLEREAQAVMNRLAPIDVRRKVGELPISSQQLVEIAKALTLDCRVLIFDEPTAALTEAEAQDTVRDHPRLEGQRDLDHLYQPPHGRNLRAFATG